MKYLFTDAFMQHQFMISKPYTAFITPAAKMCLSTKGVFFSLLCESTASAHVTFFTHQLLICKVLLNNRFLRAAGNGCVFQRQIEFCFAGRVNRIKLIDFYTFHSPLRYTQDIRLLIAALFVNVKWSQGYEYLIVLKM